jgi:hypothetical protein
VASVFGGDATGPTLTTQLFPGSVAAVALPDHPVAVAAVNATVTPLLAWYPGKSATLVAYRLFFARYTSLALTTRRRSFVIAWTTAAPLAGAAPAGAPACAAAGRTAHTVAATTTTHV